MTEAATPLPGSTDVAEVVAGAARHHVNRIAASWGLTEADIQNILAVTGQQGLWGESHEPIERLAYLIRIDVALQELLSDDVLASKWVRSPNAGAIFSGRSVLEKMCGSVTDLAEVADYLDRVLGAMYTGY